MTGTYDQMILNTAAETGGVCLRQTLLDCGVTERVIERRMASGQLRRLRKGLYLVQALQSDRTRLWAAQLAVPQSVISRRTAAQLHKMPLGLDLADDRVHITAPAHAGRRIEDVVVHESRLVGVDDVVRLDGLRVTSPARTIFDLGSELRPARLRNVMQAQFANSCPSSSEFLACFGALRRRGVDGVVRLAEAFDSVAGRYGVATSELEARIWFGLRDAGVDGFTAQFVPPWFDGIRGVVDFGHEESRTILEGDGRTWHQSQAAMLEDRRRDRIAAANGYLVLRVMWEEIEHRPTSTFAEIAQTVHHRQCLLAA